MAQPDIAPDVQAVITQVLHVVGDFTHTHADPSDWFTLVASVSSTLLTYMGFAQDMCNLVPQSHSSKKARLLGQPVGTILGM
jgi:hypothetical protein